MRTTIGIESLRRYAKCTSIALQHAYQHTVCSRADVGRRRVNPNADRVSRVAHAPLRFGRLGTIAAAPPTRHAAPNSMPFDDLAARREPDRFSATMRAALQTPPCEPSRSRRNPLPTCTWPSKSRGYTYSCIRWLYSGCIGVAAIRSRIRIGSVLYTVWDRIVQLYGGCTLYTV